MPGNRAARPRLVSNENDENIENNNSTRVTRAKSARLTISDEKMVQVKKPAPAGQRKRAALGDVSNVTKVDAIEGKRVSNAKTGLVSKAAQPSRVQKTHSRNVSSRAVLAAKDSNKTEARRGIPGSGAIGVQKRKAPLSSTTSVKEDSSMADDEPATRKKAHKLEADGPISDRHLDDFIPPEPVVVVKPLPEDVPDLDAEDLDDPLMVAEYATEIFEYLRALESGSSPNPLYMDHQDDLEWRTRGILVDWLVEVHTRFHLLPETLFLAINIIDRYLSQKLVPLDRLQLVGVTGMFIASKYEEVLSPHVANFRNIADDGFTEKEILETEREILQALRYDLSYPNPMNFLRRISKADNYDIQSRTIGKYLMEISLLDHRFMSYPPSHVAAGAMYLSRLILDRGEWDATLSYYAGYDEDEIAPIVRLMVDYLARPICHEAFFKKYASKKFLKASILTRQWAKRNAHHFDIHDLELSLDQIS